MVKNKLVLLPLFYPIIIYMNRFRFISILSLLAFLTLSLPSVGQKKSPPSNIKEKTKDGKEDPWADYEEEKDSVCRWECGISFGGYFPNKYSANYYNGSPGNINNVNYVMRVFSSFLKLWLQTNMSVVKDESVNALC